VVVYLKKNNYFLKVVSSLQEQCGITNLVLIMLLQDMKLFYIME